ncbi:putative diguanylate cyclase DgcT [Paenibacillus allorhizosphaerae]|uniref:Diguanylate cyclase DgcT n=2 Tax=Paenibacillus allorhizosphaerae TaxID=2849866 RepID=A0ABM8VGZ7_9BACL|nr:putative diguanylate cyclase DgcT [Paenibacillus allorhizosphaerae]
MIVSGYFIAIGIVSRGTELIEDLKDISKSKQDLLIKNLLMDMLSKTDALTECFNHKAFHGYLDELIERSEKNRFSLCLAIIDIDDFKQVNDSYGHWVGDLVLKSVAQTIKETVGPDDVVSRYGGEEFTLIFLDKTIEDAYRITEKIRSQVEKLIHPELRTETVTVSIGLNMFRSGQGKEKLFKGADDALYISKRMGKNKVTIYADKEDHH